MELLILVHTRRLPAGLLSEPPVRAGQVGQTPYDDPTLSTRGNGKRGEARRARVAAHAMTATGPASVAPAEGKLGVLCVGLGAVTSTLIAGVELARRGLGEPIGSLTQLGTIRLGTRTENRVPLIRDFVSLAELDDLVFGAWDVFPDDAYVSASRAGVLDAGRHLEAIGAALRAVRPMPAAFDPAYVKRLDGPNVKDGIHKRAMLEAIRADIESFRSEHLVDRLVMIWCGSTEIYIEPGPAHADIEAFEQAIDADDPQIAPSMLYAYAALQEGIPFANGAPNLTVDVPALREYANEHGVPIAGKDFKTGQTLIKTVIAPMLKARMLGLSGWYSTNILGNRDGEVLDDPESFRTKEESKLGVLEEVLEPDRYPQLYGDVYHKVRINYYPPAATTRRGGTTSTCSDGSATRCSSRSTSCAATRSSPPRWRSTYASSWTWPGAPGSAASRSGSASTSSHRRSRPGSIPSTTCSSSRRNSRTRCAG